ncbi:MAG: hypothetical protein FJ109_15210 [Deltaproteobacteria bacterium]|nr:hypothetical protein [Deltaproteobacteria bacterium]
MRRRRSRDRYSEYSQWAPYVPVAERRRKAEAQMDKLRKKGDAVAPVIIEGRTIAKTFWGKSWCENLERYGDYQNRIPRGRTYVRNGSVVDLRVAPGEVHAQVAGSRLYKVKVDVAAVPDGHWEAICKDCAGAIDSLVELLQGRFSNGVMERICRQGSGLFPSPGEIRFSCSCPDWASMCKHVAAVLYGIGARLDQDPELLFRLRRVDEKELVARAAAGMSLEQHRPATDMVLDDVGLSDLFGIDMAGDSPRAPVPELGTMKRTAAPAGTGKGKKKAATPVAAGKPKKKVDALVNTGKTKEKAAASGTAGKTKKKAVATVAAGKTKKKAVARVAAGKTKKKAVAPPKP